MIQPTGVKAGKNHIEDQHKQNVQMNNANESMRKIADSHDRKASVMVQKQKLLEKQGKLSSLWKLE